MFFYVTEIQANGFQWNDSLNIFPVHLVESPLFMNIYKPETA